MPTATPGIIPPRRTRDNGWVDGLAVVLGSALTLSIHGYRFGEGNHTIYLLDALRRARPELLANDWFVNQTLQYHAAFGIIAQKLIEWRVIEPAFFIGYLLLIGLFHFAWLRIVQNLGAGHAGYLASAALYYASAAGTGLGMYQFFQDSSFLPSNIANVAMLWGLYFWLRGRIPASGACIGVAGLFHLNHAAVGVVMWAFLCVTAAKPSRSMFIGSVLALAPAMINILLAAQVRFQRSGTMPLAEFVDLYVRLRHPHHYDPSSWPIWLWISFFWPVPLALAALWGRRKPPARQARLILLFFLSLQLVALVAAGFWFFSESLVQLSLYRFSIFIQLLACVGVATGLAQRARTRMFSTVATIACASMIVICLLRGPFFGAFVMPGDDADYLAVCDWARENAPRDAVILVPPAEESMRLRGQRAIVVNYKAVPQLSAELPEWRDRLETVLVMDNLRALPRGYGQTMRALDQRYAQLSAPQLFAAAERYEARFVVSVRRLDEPHAFAEAFISPNRRYFVYDRLPMEETGNE